MKSRFLQLTHHTVTGVTLSDTHLRFVTLKQHDQSILPEQYADLPIPEGCLDDGKIIDKKKFISFLKKTRKQYKLDHIQLSLLSSQIQVFTLSTKAAGALYIKEAVEKEFGLPAKEIIYDYHAIAGNDTTTTFRVVTIPKAISQDLTTCFKKAGLTILSLESVGHALRRDLLPIHTEQTTMIVAIDSDITTIAFVVNGMVAQTTLFVFGDQHFIEAISDGLDVNNDKAKRLKHDHGLMGKDPRGVFDAVVDDCVALVHHINHEYVTWRTAHPSVPPLETIYLTGAGSNLKGLDEYIAAGLRIPVQEGNVWTNCLSYDEHIPAMPQSVAVQYAAAIGIALSGADAINLLPLAHKQALRRHHVIRISGRVILSFLLGAIVGFVVARVLLLPSAHTWLMATLHKIRTQW